MMCKNLKETREERFVRVIATTTRMSENIKTSQRRFHSKEDPLIKCTCKKWNKTEINSGSRHQKHDPEIGEHKKYVSYTGCVSVCKT